MSRIQWAHTRWLRCAQKAIFAVVLSLLAGVLGTFAVMLLPAFAPYAFSAPPPLGKAALHGDVAGLNRDLARGVRVDERGNLHEDRLNQQNATALHFAAISGQVMAAEVLLAAGADPNAQTSAGLTPVWLTAEGNHSAVAQALLAAGAQPDRADDRGRNPLHVAAEHGATDVAQALLNAGAHVNARTKSRQVHSLEASWTPLHFAARYRQLGMTRLLLERGADLNAKDGDGRTPLDEVTSPDDDARQAVADLLRAHGAGVGKAIR